MKKILNKIANIFNNRALVLIILVVLIGVIYLIQLFNLQIVNGEEYREQSSKKMLRTETVTAARGEITDRNGVILATNKLSFDVQLYKVRVDTSVQNESIEKLITILELNGDKIYSTFPVNDTLDGFSFSDTDEEKEWKEENNIDENASFDDVIKKYTEKYEITTNDRKLAIKIIQVKYEGALNGYSLFNSAIVAKDISEKSLAMIEEEKANLYGVETLSTTKRYYPYGYLMSHVLGYVGKISKEEYDENKDDGYTYNSIVGKYGIELSLEKYLKGEDGIKKIEVDSLGKTNQESITEEAQAGDNVTLTIDYRLQKVAEEALVSTINDIRNGKNNYIKTDDAKSGSVVVLDVNTGEVLAMVSYPSFDSNELSGNISAKRWKEIQNDALKPLYNRAISGTYSPGSTFKMLVGLAGLSNNVITTKELITDTGVYKYGHHPKCWIYEKYGTTHGSINISTAIKVSCNCYFYEVGRRLGIDNIIDYAKKFGLGQKTGVELSGESQGTIAGENQEEWYLGDTLSAAIGQSGNSYTPIQLANYISTLANGGNLNAVSLIKNVNSESGQQVSTQELKEYIENFTGVKFESEKIDLNEEYINAVKEGMLSVTSESGGTSYIVFKGSNMQVAGKTGTAQVSSGSNNGIFVGFAPYDNPKIAVVAVIEHGREGTYTANVVKPIMEEYFNISNKDTEIQKEQSVVNNSIKY